MRTVTVKEMLNQLPDAPVTQTRGKFVAIFDRKAGEGERGPWSFQGATFADNTGEIRVTLKNRDPLDARMWKGKDVILIAHQRTNGGVSGLKVGESEYQGKTRKELVVTGTAKIELDTPDGAPADNAPDRDPDDVPMDYPTDDAPPVPDAAAVAKGKAVAEKQLAEAQAKRTKPAPTAPSEYADDDQGQDDAPTAKASPSNPVGEWGVVMRGMAQQARMLEVATRAALKIVVPVYMTKGIEPSVEAVQAMAATILIQWGKEYGGRVEIPHTPVPQVTKTN